MLSKLKYESRIISISGYSGNPDTSDDVRSIPLYLSSHPRPSQSHTHPAQVLSVNPYRKSLAVIASRNADVPSTSVRDMYAKLSIGEENVFCLFSSRGLTLGSVD